MWIIWGCRGVAGRVVYLAGLAFLFEFIPELLDHHAPHGPLLLELGHRILSGLALPIQDPMEPFVKLFGRHRGATIPIA